MDIKLKYLYGLTEDIQNPKFKDIFNELCNCIKNISDQEIRLEFDKYCNETYKNSPELPKRNKPNKSPAIIINKQIKKSLRMAKWKSEEPIFVHSVCSSQKMDSEDALYNLVEKCSSFIEKPTEPFCCGTGGDRIFRVPNLPKNAIDKSISNTSFSKGVSSSRTCELGLSEQTGIKFSSIESLVYNALKR